MNIDGAKTLFLSKCAGIFLLAVSMCLLAACSAQTGGASGSSETATPISSTQTAATFPSTQKTATPASAITQGATAAEPFRAIRFVDQTHGWALTTDKVMRSLDGGKSWVDMTERGNGGSMMDGGKNAEAVFQTADRAWVFVAERKNGAQNPGVTVHVWRTSDGGQHWDQSTFDDHDAIDFNDRPNFADAQVGWILLYTGAGAGSYGTHLYQTTDSGVTWKQIAAAPGNIPLSGEKYGPSFEDEKDGWLANHVGARSDAPLLYRTVDGGIHWSQQPLPLVSSFTNADYRTTPPVNLGVIILIPTHVSIANAKHLVMYASANGGNRWFASQPASFDTDNVYIIDQNHIVALDNGTTYITNDAGQHWSQGGSLPATSDAMSFITAQEGWSLDTKSAVLYHTTNGGSSWDTINYSFVPAS